MPVELPKRNKRGLPIMLSIGALAASAVVTLAIQPKEDPAPRMQVVGVVAVRSADPTSTGSRIPDPLEIQKKKKAKKKAAPAASSNASAGTAVTNDATVASSGGTSSGYTGSGATASRSSGAVATQRSSAPKRSSGSSGTSAAEAEFGPG